MKSNRLELVVASILISLLLATPLWAEKGHGAQNQPPGGETLSMAKFYAGPLETIGTFPGKLVCLRCDLGHAPNAAAVCKEKGHVHALSMDDGSMIHPLLAGTQQALQQINSPQLHDKEVTVAGKYYPSTGAILVSRITPREPGSSGGAP